MNFHLRDMNLNNNKDFNYYDDISPSYEELHKEEQLKKIAIIKKNFPVSVTDLLLDIGSGPGFLSFDCSVVRLDPSIELLRRSQGMRVLGIAEQLPFKQDVFDKAVSITAMQNFDNMDLALGEIKRVCKPNAEIAFSFLNRSEKKDAIERALKDNLEIKKVIVEDKDLIYFGRV